MAFKDVFQFVCERRVFARLFEAKFSEGHQPEVLVDLLGEHKKLSTITTLEVHRSLKVSLHMRTVFQ